MRKRKTPLQKELRYNNAMEEKDLKKVDWEERRL